MVLQISKNGKLKWLIYSLLLFYLHLFYENIYIYIEKRISFSEIMYFLIPLTLMFLVSVSPFMITYPGTHVMFDQVIILNMIIIGLLILLTKKYHSKMYYRKNRKYKLSE